MRKRKCRWLTDDDEHYITSCGAHPIYVGDWIGEEKYNYCPYCGLEIDPHNKIGTSLLSKISYRSKYGRWLLENK